MVFAEVRAVREPPLRGMGEAQDPSLRGGREEGEEGCERASPRFLAGPRNDRGAGGGGCSRWKGVGVWGMVSVQVVI